MTNTLGPFKLMSVNTAPERAKRLIGRIIEDVKDKYEIHHVANAETLEQVPALVEEFKPDVLFCASMWTPEQSSEVFATARKIVPNVKTLAIPTGLQVNKGPDAVVEWVKEKLPGLIES